MSTHGSSLVPEGENTGFTWHSYETGGMADLGTLTRREILPHADGDGGGDGGGSDSSDHSNSGAGGDDDNGGAGSDNGNNDNGGSAGNDDDPGSAGVSDGNDDPGSDNDDGSASNGNDQSNDGIDYNVTTVQDFHPATSDQLTSQSAYEQTSEQPNHSIAFSHFSFVAPASTGFSVGTAGEQSFTIDGPAYAYDSNSGAYSTITGSPAHPVTVSRNDDGSIKISTKRQYVLAIGNDGRHSSRCAQ